MLSIALTFEGILIYVKDFFMFFRLYCANHIQSYLKKIPTFPHRYSLDNISGSYGTHSRGSMSFLVSILEQLYILDIIRTVILCVK